MNLVYVLFAVTIWGDTEPKETYSIKPHYFDTMAECIIARDDVRPRLRVFTGHNNDKGFPTASYAWCVQSHDTIGEGV